MSDLREAFAKFWARQSPKALASFGKGAFGYRIFPTLQTTFQAGWEAALASQPSGEELTDTFVGFDDPLAAKRRFIKQPSGPKETSMGDLQAVLDAAPTCKTCGQKNVVVAETVRTPICPECFMVMPVLPKVPASDLKAKLESLRDELNELANYLPHEQSEDPDQGMIPTQSCGHCQILCTVIPKLTAIIEGKD